MWVYGEGEGCIQSVNMSGQCVCLSGRMHNFCTEIFSGRIDLKCMSTLILTSPKYLPAKVTETYIFMRQMKKKILKENKLYKIVDFYI